PYVRLRAGLTATLTGTGFDPIPANNVVRFKSATGMVNAEMVSGTTSSLTITIPPEAICGPVVVSTGNQTSNPRMAAFSDGICGVQLMAISEGGSPGETIIL